MRKLDVVATVKALILCGLCLLLAAPARAVVLHDDSDPVPTGTANRPADVLIGRWSNWASCVPIGPNYVVTTQHQGGDVGATVTVGGVSYRAAEIFYHGAADLKLVRLTTLTGEDANLTDWATLYTGRAEDSQIAVIGGYGMGRGDVLTASEQAYGYKSAGNHNLTLRWGANRIDNVTVRTTAGYTSDTLWSDFDDVGTGGHVAHEASVSFYDSGGGWFVQEGDQWQLAGLTWTVRTHYAPGHDGEADYMQSWFRRNTNPSILYPDPLDAVRVSSYVGWMTALMAGPVDGDANRDGVVNVYDLAILANNYGTPTGADWSMADFTGDGAVDVLDLAALANTYGFGSGTDAESLPPAAGVNLPEQASLLLLGVGVPMILRRKRRGRPGRG